jgi:signal peptidase I
VSDVEDRPEDLEPPADAPGPEPESPFVPSKERYLPDEPEATAAAPSTQPYLAPEQPIAPFERAPLPPASGDNHGWPTPPPAASGSSFGAPPGQPEGAEPAPPVRPFRHSRNPVDRLTRGLPDPARITIDWIVTIAGAIAIVLIVKAFVVNPYRIPSSSMEPTLHCARSEPGCEAGISDRVLANRFLYRLRDPRRGEIIVFKTPPAARIKCGAGGTFVKRLIGLPGDTLELKLRKGNGYVYINGKPLKEPYIQDSRRAAVQGFGPVKIAPGHYFMMGDNRSQSCDSRMWGTVPRKNLIGKVFATYWPPNRISLH